MAKKDKDTQYSFGFTFVEFNLNAGGSLLIKPEDIKYIKAGFNKDTFNVCLKDKSFHLVKHTLKQITEKLGKASYKFIK